MSKDASTFTFTLKQVNYLLGERLKDLPMKRFADYINCDVPYQYRGVVYHGKLLPRNVHGGDTILKSWKTYQFITHQYQLPHNTKQKPDVIEIESLLLLFPDKGNLGWYFMRTRLHSIKDDLYHFDASATIVPVGDSNFLEIVSPGNSFVKDFWRQVIQWCSASINDSEQKNTRLRRLSDSALTLM